MFDIMLVCYALILGNCSVYLHVPAHDCCVLLLTQAPIVSGLLLSLWFSARRYQAR